MKIANFLNIVKNYNIPTNSDLVVSIQDEDGKEKAKGLVSHFIFNDKEQISLVLPESAVAN